MIRTAKLGQVSRRALSVVNEGAVGVSGRPSSRALVSLIGWTKAPLPAESHTAKRTHFLPVVSKGIWK
jgi:hypothetical protein